MYYLRDPKTIITVLSAFALALIFEPAIPSGKYAFSIIVGLLVPVFDGLFWGKDRWDQHPILYALAGIVFVIVQILIGRESRIPSGIALGVGMVLMQAFLFYTGKIDRDS